MIQLNWLALQLFLCAVTHCELTLWQPGAAGAFERKKLGHKARSARSQNVLLKNEHMSTCCSLLNEC